MTSTMYFQKTGTAWTQNHLGTLYWYDSPTYGVFFDSISGGIIITPNLYLDNSSFHFIEGALCSLSAGDDFIDSLDDNQAALSPTGTTISITSANGSDSDGYSPRFKVGDIIKIDTELMQIASIPADNTLIVTRGYYNTPAAAHVAGVSIYVNRVRMLFGGYGRFQYWTLDQTSSGCVITNVGGNYFTGPSHCRAMSNVFAWMEGNSYKSTTSGSSWSAGSFPDLIRDGVQSADIDASGSAIMAIDTGQTQLYLSSSFDSGWAATVAMPSDTLITAIRNMRQATNAKAWLAAGEKISYTPDGGVTWQDKTGDMAMPGGAYIEFMLVIPE